MKRLFAFGCSFTGYGWPTWADIIGQSFDYYENWGKSGIGNYLISSRVVERLPESLGECSKLFEAVRVQVVVKVSLAD